MTRRHRSGAAVGSLSAGTAGSRLVLGKAGASTAVDENEDSVLNDMDRLRSS